MQTLLLKLSGEALGGASGSGIDPTVLEHYANEIRSIVDQGIGVAVVLGGGNLFRGAKLSDAGMDRVVGDRMGMLATIMDISMGHLIKEITGKAGITLEMKNQFLRPLTNGPASCEGKYIRQGRSVSFLESRVWDSNQKLIAHGTSTWKMGS